jgi:hypothetical protein
VKVKCHYTYLLFDSSLVILFANYTRCFLYINPLPKGSVSKPKANQPPTSPTIRKQKTAQNRFYFSVFQHNFEEILNAELTYRQLTALIFLVAFVAQIFNKNFVVADYYTNTAKYAKNCENKAKPKMRCNGKCQMMKKLQEEEKKDQENPERKNENKIVLSTKSFFATISRSYKPRIAKKLYPQIANNYAYRPAYSVFHPPKV